MHSVTNAYVRTRLLSYFIGDGAEINPLATVSRCCPLCKQRSRTCYGGWCSAAAYARLCQLFKVHFGARAKGLEGANSGEPYTFPQVKKFSQKKTLLIERVRKELFSSGCTDKSIHLELAY